MHDKGYVFLVKLVPVIYSYVLVNVCTGSPCKLFSYSGASV